MDIIGDFRRDKALFIQSAGLFIFSAALPFSVTLIQGGILLFIFAGLWRRRAGGTFAALPSEIKANPLFLPWLLYLGAGLLAAALGMAPAKGFSALNSDLLTAVSFLGACLFMEPGQRDTAVKIYLAAVLLAAMYGIAQALDGLAQGLNVRAHATQHPVRFGEIITIGMALAVSRLAKPEGLSPRAKSFLYAAAVIMVSAIVFSQTRGAYLGMMLVFFSLLFIMPKLKRFLLPFAAGVLALSFALSAMNPVIRYKLGSFVKAANSVVNTSAKAPDQAVGTRLVLWKIGYKMIKDRPVFGAGPGSVKKLFPLYCPEPYPENTVWGSLHNLYIHQAAERGLLGLAALLTLFSFMFITALRGFKAAPSGLTIWALTIMPSWFLMNMTEITFQHVHTSYAVLFALAVSAASAKR